MHPYNPIICAVDTRDMDRAVAMATALSGKVAMMKLGLEFFTSHGIEGVQKIIDLGFGVFLDLKLHDIPNTVVGALNSIKKLKIAMVTLHISGGKEMMRSAVNALEGSSIIPVGVTVLTSMDNADLRECGITAEVDSHVMKLVDLAVESGLEAVVCSAYEIGYIRRKYPTMKLIVPGIRVETHIAHDQKRVKTPKDAMAAGADYLVIGRAITNSADPVGVVDKILSTF